MNLPTFLNTYFEVLQKYEVSFRILFLSFETDKFFIFCYNFFFTFFNFVLIGADEDAELENGGFDNNFVQRQTDYAERSQSMNSEDARAAARALRQGEGGGGGRAAPSTRPTPPTDDEDDEERMCELITYMHRNGEYREMNIDIYPCQEWRV